METPFEREGYTKDTKFKVLKDFYTVKKGDVVTLHCDDGSVHPCFTTGDGRIGYAFFPSKLPYSQAQLEVCTELTPFEEAGYTKETKFKALTKDEDIEVGDVVTLAYDGGTYCVVFKTQDNRKGYMYLPGLERGRPVDLEVYEEPKKLTPLEDLEVYEESSLIYENINSQLIKKDLFDLAVKHDVSLSQLEKTLKEIK